MEPQHWMNQTHVAQPHVIIVGGGSVPGGSTGAQKCSGPESRYWTG